MLVRSAIHHRYFRLLLVTLFGAYSLIVILGTMGTARNSAQQSICDGQLRNASHAIFELYDSKGFPPTRDDVLLILQTGMNQRHAGYSEPHRGYAVANTITFPSTGPPEIIVCDAPGNHMQYHGNGFRVRRNGVWQECASLLYSDGSIQHWHGDSNAYAQWVSQFETQPHPGTLPESSFQRDVALFP